MNYLRFCVWCNIIYKTHFLMDLLYWKLRILVSRILKNVTNLDNQNINDKLLKIMNCTNKMFICLRYLFGEIYVLFLYLKTRFLCYAVLICKSFFGKVCLGSKIFRWILFDLLCIYTVFEFFLL